MLSTCNFSYAYDVESSQLELFDSESTEQGFSEIFGLDNTEISNKTTLNVSDSNEINYSMEIIEELEDEAEISLSGNFILNNKQCNFESQGFVDIVDYENDLRY